MPPFIAALLSFVVPGLGQASVGKFSRALIVAFPTLALLGAFGDLVYVNPDLLFGSIPNQGLLVSLLALDGLLAVYHLGAALDAYFLARRARSDQLPFFETPRKWPTALAVAILVLATTGVHVAAAEVTIGWQRLLGCNTGATACRFDISYPQCGSQFPDNGGFGLLGFPGGDEPGIVGVNKGKVMSANPCLGPGDGPSELTWAGGTRAQLYINTGNPGPDLSTRWPTNQAVPRACQTTLVPDADTADCAYDYGWNAAADSYRTAVAAYVALGLAAPGSTATPAANMWWLDVEIENSWRDDTSLNVAALQGEVDYLQSVNIAGIGFYSTQYQWNQVTGGTSAFTGYPSWVAGAASAEQAVGVCGSQGFTGGPVRMIQYQTGGFDADFVCRG